MPRRILFIFLVFLLGGCSTSFTNMMPARTLAPGEAAASVAYQVDVHTQVLESALELNQANDIPADFDGNAMTEEELRELLDAALMLQLFFPGSTPEISGRVGVMSRADVGFRYNGAVLKGDFRALLWSNDEGNYSLSAQFGYGYHSSTNTTIFESITIASGRRDDYDFQLNLGYEYKDSIKLYTSPRLIISNIRTQVRLSDEVVERLPESWHRKNSGNFFHNSTIFYYGASWGGMFGYKYLFVVLELNFFRTTFRPVVLEKQRDYSGWTLAPALGLVVMWP